MENIKLYKRLLRLFYIHVVYNAHKMSVKLAESEAWEVTCGTSRALKGSSRIIETAFVGADWR